MTPSFVFNEGALMSAVSACQPSSPLFLGIDAEMFYWIEKVSAVALGALAAYSNFPLFLLAAGFGCWIGISHPSPAPTCRSVSCSQGLLEQLTGVRLPAVISLACNIAMTGMHITHHAEIVVPIVAVALGAWAGKTVQEA